MHNLFGERFYTLRQPAWHTLGEVGQEGEGAVSIARRIGGDYVVTMEPVFVTEPGSKRRIQVDGYASAVRHPTDDDPNYRVFNVVSADYSPVTMMDVALAFDEFVAADIETLGVLDDGARGFVSTKLPTIDVKGDEVEMYLGATYSFTGANSAEVWPLRVVCANTLAMAQARSTVAYRIVHDGTARERMGTWLADAYAEAVSKHDLLKGVFELLADKPARTATADKVFRVAWPDPTPPTPNAPADVMRARMERYENRILRRQRFRNEAVRLFEGEGTGATSRAAKGTMWGVVNAVTEVENYRKGSFRGDEAVNVGKDVMFGARRENMVRATAYAVDLAQR